MTRVHHVLLDAAAEEALGMDEKESGQPHPWWEQCQPAASSLRDRGPSPRAAPGLWPSPTWAEEGDEKVKKTVHLQGHPPEGSQYLPQHCRWAAVFPQPRPTVLASSLLGKRTSGPLVSQEGGRWDQMEERQSSGTHSPWLRAQEEEAIEGHTQAGQRDEDARTIRSMAARHVFTGQADVHDPICVHDPAGQGLHKG